MIAAALALGCLWVAGLVPPHPLQDEIDRLIGHELETSSDSYKVLSAAGEGAPLVGCVRLRGDSLVLVSGHGTYPLTGPLAIPRIAGPNYKVWIIGDLDADQHLFARRIGILASPKAAQCPVSSG